MTLTIGAVLAHPIARALNPEGKAFLQTRPLSGPLAPSGANITALIPFGIFPHIKTIATFNMMVSDFLDELYRGKHTLVVDSSGNTAHAAARLAPAFGFRHVKIVVPSDIADSKRNILNALSSVELIELPGGVAERAKEEGRREGHYHLNQYAHAGNMKAHEKFTGPAIAERLGTMVSAIAIAMGSGGTAAGVGKFFKTFCPHTKILGVRPKLGEQVPGARDERRMREVVTLPWQEYVDEVIDISRKDAFIAMRRLWGQVEPQPGPTSGLAYAGLLEYLKQRPPGGLSAFICPDDGRFYSERITGELDPDQGMQ